MNKFNKKRNIEANQCRYNMIRPDKLIANCAICARMVCVNLRLKVPDLTIKHILLVLAAAAVLAGLNPLQAEAAPHINSKYYCLVDGGSGQPILAKNANTPRPIASTTKIMTAILTVEYADPGEQAIVSKNASVTPEYTIGLRSGQKITIGELMKASLIKSSNDAAVVLAEHVAGDEEFFAHLMSKKAFAIGAMQTHFRNASGLPQKDSYSTAYDLTRMGCYALTKPLISKLVATRETSFQHPGYLQPMTIRNTNGLLGTYPGVTGIKTGTANESGKCLIASASRDGRQLIAVALKSGDRNGDCARLFDYGFKNTARCQVIDSRQVFKSAKINKGCQSFADIVPAHDLWLWMGDKKVDIQKKVRMNYTLEAPLPAGLKVGEMDIYVEGRYLETIDLLTRAAVAREPNIFHKTIKQLFTERKTGIKTAAKN